MDAMQTLVTNVCDVCQSVCHMAQLGLTVWGSFGAAFAKSLWPFVSDTTDTVVMSVANICRRHDHRVHNFRNRRLFTFCLQ